MPPVGKGSLPIEPRVRQRIAVGERIAYDVRRGVGDAALNWSRGSRPGDGLPHDVRLERAVRAGQADDLTRRPPAAAARGGGPRRPRPPPAQEKWTGATPSPPGPASTNVA